MLIFIKGHPSTRTNQNTHMVEFKATRVVVLAGNTFPARTGQQYAHF